MATLQEVVDNRLRWGFVIKSQDEKETVLECVDKCDPANGQHYDSVYRLEISDGEAGELKNTFWNDELELVMKAELSEVRIDEKDRLCWPAYKM